MDKMHPQMKVDIKPLLTATLTATPPNPGEPE
jgi:hypothetical protein